ncbi:histidine--tRNA ligase [Patescibacteria group bacterium]|nr:histidine--tRNA ligase [Patescibacteria group bacterium]
MSERETLSTEPYKGVRDFYPEDWTRLQSVFDTFRTTLQSYGYEEYNASPLERSELFENKTSEEIVNEQTYSFFDRGDRKVTLRPEMTPTFARMVAGKRRELVFPLRWFSIPNVFRYERPQRGRLREHYQLNVDLAGISDMKADGEMIVIASTLLRALGAKNTDFVVRVNSRSLLTAACRAAGYTTDEAIRSYSHLLDRKSKMTPEEFSSALDNNREDPLKIIANESDPAVAKEKSQLVGLIDGFKARGMTNIVFDPEIVRGFDYYTGTVFEIFDTNTENARSLFGGGRYDQLIAMFGGEPIPCVGFAVGDVTLLDFLSTHEYLPEIRSAADLFIGTPAESDIGHAQKYAEELRTEGLRVLVNATSKTLSDQIREASRRGIPSFLAFGEEEAASGTVRLKNLAASTEKELPKADVPAALK